MLFFKSEVRSDPIFLSGFQISDRSEVRSNSIRSNSKLNQSNIKNLSSQQLRPNSSYTTLVSPSIDSGLQCCCTASFVENLYLPNLPVKKLEIFTRHKSSTVHSRDKSFNSLQISKSKYDRLLVLYGKKWHFLLSENFSISAKAKKKLETFAHFCQF